MTNTPKPGEIPKIPEENPLPEKVPEIQPTIVPENPTLPQENPAALPHVEPFQPDIPTEIPPYQQ